MAARLNPHNVQATRQSLHHLVAKAPWSDQALLNHVRQRVLPAMQKHGPVVGWIVDDTGFPKKGQHSVGVTRQYCGQVGKQENCRIAVSLSVATWDASLPIAYRLYLPKDWAEDAERREKTEVPEEVEFQTKPEIALDQIRAAVAAQVAGGVVLADAAYGINTEFREGLTQLKLQYVVGVQSSLTVWEPGKQPLPSKPRGNGAAPAIVAADCGPSAGLGEAVGDEPALWGVPRNHLAGRYGPKVAIPLCRRSGAPSASRLRESRTSRGGMVTDRMASKRARTHEVLDIHAASEYPAQSLGQDGQAPLDHREGLPGVETRIRAGAL